MFLPKVLKISLDSSFDDIFFSTFCKKYVLKVNDYFSTFNLLELVMPNAVFPQEFPGNYFFNFNTRTQFSFPREIRDRRIKAI